MISILYGLKRITSFLQLIFFLLLLTTKTQKEENRWNNYWWKQWDTIINTKAKSSVWYLAIVLWKQSRQRSQGQFLCSDKGGGGFQTVGVQKTNPVILSCSETHSAHSSIQFGVKTKIDGAHSIIQGIPKNALSHLPLISRRLSIPDHQINWWLGMLAILKVRFLGHPVVSVIGARNS